MRERQDVQQPVKRQRRNAIRPNSDEARAIQDVAAAYRNDESIASIRSEVSDISIDESNRSVTVTTLSVPMTIFSRIVSDSSAQAKETPEATTSSAVSDKETDEKSQSSSEDDAVNSEIKVTNENDGSDEGSKSDSSE